MHTSLQGLKCDTAAIISMLYCFSTVSLYQDKRRRVNSISGWKQHLMGRYILPKQGYIIICLQCKSIGCCKLPILLLPKMAKMNYYDLNNPSVPHLLCFEGQPMWRWGREWQPVYVVSVQSRWFFFYLHICLRSDRKSAGGFILWDPKNCSDSAFDPVLSITHMIKSLIFALLLGGKLMGREGKDVGAKLRRWFWRYERGVGYISWMGWEVWGVLKRTVGAVEREEHARTGKGLRKGKGKILVTLQYLKCPSGLGPLPPFLLAVFPCIRLYTASPMQLNLSALLTSPHLFCHPFSGNVFHPEKYNPFSASGQQCFLAMYLWVSSAVR